ncbi:molybdenum cofactor biosysynthesis protein [Aeromicrobium yanjiei]|uniref:Molybdenum cofactor biosysynthesis protein n=1 Tax=Aeromicrobium yanjiei TaxID=2662028 RepID=A0A5Q2MJ28_9ACTN|nr:molybdenum cofactor biosysynthesis protein [Aeromicrobium yanjiei]QGG43057.1 molybdenum cofactor biosysynthesis protein [Aeromicrobium yanjiei]
MELEIVALVVSPVHRYEGRPHDGVLPYDGDESPTIVQVRAHRGLVGDRFFGTRHSRYAVTFFAAEQIDWLQDEIAGEGLFPATTEPFDPVLARRNVVTRGLDVDALVRTTFTIDAGHGPIRFISRTAASPCAWMNEVYAPGAHRALRGRGGIRAEPLDDGVLAVGPATIGEISPLSA